MFIPSYDVSCSDMRTTLKTNSIQFVTQERMHCRRYTNDNQIEP